MPNYYFEDGYLRFTYEGTDYLCSSIFQEDTFLEDDYILTFLTSPYYLAEQDVHTIYMGRKSDKYQVGVILPLQFLDEDDPDNIMDIPSFYFRYANLAIRKILSFLISLKKLPDDKSEFRLTDVFIGNGISFSLTSIHECGNDIQYMLPSIYDNGYYFVNDPFVDVPSSLYKSDYMSLLVEERKQRKNRKLYIDVIPEYLKNKSFYHYLYTELLPNITNPFYRFIVLYQIIEYLSNCSYHMEYDCAIEKYSKGEISKNALRERLIKAANGEKQINKIYEGVTWKDDTILQSKIRDIVVKCSLDKNEKLDSLESSLYALRNKIVHEMTLLIHYRTDMTVITEYLDKNIFNLLVKCKVKRL